QRERVRAVGGDLRCDAPKLCAMRDDLRVGGVVLDDKQALARKLRLETLPWRRRGGRGGFRLDGEMEIRSLAGITFHPDFSAHHFAQPFADGQSQAGAAVMARSRS